MASRAFVAVPRTVLFVMEDPATQDGRRRIVAQIKSNLGPKAAPLAFEIDERQVAEDPDDGQPVTTGVLRWTREAPSGTVPEMLAAAQRGPEKTKAADRAADWLLAWLREHSGRAEASQTVKAAIDAGHKERTLYRARADLGVTAEDAGTYPRRTFWVLPDACSANVLGGSGRVAEQAQETTTGSTTTTYPAETPPPPGLPVLPDCRTPRASGTTGAAGPAPGQAAEYERWLRDRYGDGPVVS
jgi:hypothetical protein